MTTPATSARQRLVGSSLREYRESAGYDLGDAARILECDRSKVSRIETGQRSIRAKELRELLAEYGADAAVEEALVALARPRRDGTGWWTEYASMLRDPYLEFVAAETAASAIIAYAPVQVPELLQVPDYARAAAAADASVPEEWEAAAAAAVLARQRVTLHQRATRLDVVIGEAVLRQELGDASVMHAQIAHLAELAGGCRHVTIRLLPFDVGLPSAGGAGGFTVLRFGPVPTLGLVHVEGPDGGLCPDTPRAAIGYLRAFNHLQAFALSPEYAAQRLLRLASRR
jgi:transcriptional regulator with XRE-family HTH domain